ncbi:hypothetical protein [Geodermatophilus normandii]|uniref:Uncharacterized protein n=1 Tax=Geodermatophilus normandii TaxID=1137989 RepID=A0A6P0GFA6_9ACTN|nr:hypothetical protein [Geodermatophilus normandii]NEM05922.1 hypothetical protein [Geodermatophilus normandii]
MLPRPWLRKPEVHLFVLWSEARALEQRILDDIAAHFTVLELVEVTWTPGEVFAGNLSRMYGDALPPGSDKEVHCGSGPFLAVVVRDERPRYRVRRTNRGPQLLPSNVFDARSRYRQWTGGGYRVHASDSTAEAERNLVLLLGRWSAEFPRGDGAIRSTAGDPLGTDGWRSVGELVMALEAHGGSLASRSTGPDCDRLTVRTPDAWWAERITGGHEVRPRVLDVPVADGTVRLDLVEVRPRRTLNWVDHVRPVIRTLRRLRAVVRPSG